MARPPRIAYPGAFYHITPGSNERKAIFKSRADRQRFLAYFESATTRDSAVIHGYCLMDNHYHLLLETPAGSVMQAADFHGAPYPEYFTQRAHHEVSIGFVIKGPQ